MNADDGMHWSGFPQSDADQVRSVIGGVRRDRQVSNLLYGLLGWEDERDPQAAIASLTVSARSILAGAGPEYRQRVFAALRLLDGLLLDVAENAYPDWAARPAAELLASPDEPPPTVPEPSP